MSTRRVLFLFGGAALLGGAAISITRDVQATNYPLDCNGVDFLEIEAVSTGVNVSAIVGHASQGYDQALEPPDNCAWHDRGMRDTESYGVDFPNGQSPNISISHSADFIPANGLDDSAWITMNCNGLDPNGVDCALARAYQGSRVRFVIGTTHDESGDFVPVSATVE